MDIEEIKFSYYSKYICPTMDNLKLIIKIFENFGEHGAQQLMYALHMNHIDREEVENLSQYIVDVREKMEKELIRVKKYKDTYNHEYATDYNGYYNAVANMLGKMRSHIAPLKKVLKMTCPRRHPNRLICLRHNIESKSIVNESMLGLTYYQEDVFDINNYPDEVKGLYTELKKFFKAEYECFKICNEILNEEKRIKDDPDFALHILNKNRIKIYKKIKNMTMLVTGDTLDMLKCVNPLYLQRQKYETDRSFAPSEFHKHNTAEMDHFCTIEFLEKDSEFSNEEYVLFGKAPDKIRNVKKVIANFDDLLPEGFSTRQMGEYQYMFCQWAVGNNNIKGSNAYLTKHYNGKYKLRGYGAVNKHARNYDKNSSKTAEFISRINLMLNTEPQNNQEKMMAK